MATGSAARVIRAPGRVVINPTDLSAAYPYGGTQVGLTKMCVLHPVTSNFRVVSEGLGGEATDVLHSQHEFVFSCLLRGWDDDALRLFWPRSYTAGSASGHAVFSAPGQLTAGMSMLSHAVILLFVPDDIVAVPAVLIYRGIPDWGEGAQLLLQRSEELGLPLAVDCLRDSNDHILQVGRLADLSLT